MFSFWIWTAALVSVVLRVCHFEMSNRCEMYRRHSKKWILACKTEIPNFKWSWLIYLLRITSKLLNCFEVQLQSSRLIAKVVLVNELQTFLSITVMDNLKETLISLPSTIVSNGTNFLLLFYFRNFSLSWFNSLAHECNFNWPKKSRRKKPRIFPYNCFLFGPNH